MKKNVLLFVCFMMSLSIFSGCVKPPKVEKYEEVKNNETAFVIQLEGDSQAKMDSLESLKKMQVSTKRINLPQRFRKTGRWGWQGVWIPTVKVIKVDRSPVTREWSKSEKTGTKTKNEAIWVESKDSIGFSTGFNCTAMVTETDAATFLYYYPGGSLARVMDSQIRNEIQAVASEEAAAFPMDKCRERKVEIIKAVREKVIPKFAEKGITVTTIGMFGGFAYEDKEIQTSINATFVAQQEKVVSKAQLEAQEDKNKTIEKEAIGLKNAAITKAQGEAEAVTIKAEAEAEAVRAVAKASQEANSNPVFIELKKLEVELAKLKVWDGKLPQWYMAGSGNQDDMNIMIQPPTK